MGFKSLRRHCTSCCIFCFWIDWSCETQTRWLEGVVKVVLCVCGGVICS